MWELKANVMKSTLEIALNLGSKGEPQVQELFRKLLAHSLTEPVVPDTPPKLKAATRQVIKLLDSSSKEDDAGVPVEKTSTFCEKDIMTEEGRYKFGKAGSAPVEKTSEEKDIVTEEGRYKNGKAGSAPVTLVTPARCLTYPSDQTEFEEMTSAVNWSQKSVMNLTQPRECGLTDKEGTSTQPTSFITGLDFYQVLHWRMLKMMATKHQCPLAAAAALVVMIKIVSLLF